jgi:hypothetical protein
MIVGRRDIKMPARVGFSRRMTVIQAQHPDDHPYHQGEHGEELGASKHVHMFFLRDA